MNATSLIFRGKDKSYKSRQHINSPIPIMVVNEKTVSKDYICYMMYLMSMEEKVRHMWSCPQFSAVHTNTGKAFTLLKGNKMSHSSRVSPLNNDPSVLSKGCLSARNFFPMMQWCNTHLLWHLCWESHFLEGPFPSDKIHISFCLCLSWPGCPWITCWDWLHDRGQIKWVLWLAWTATVERNRCCSLAHTDVPIAAEPCDWWREDTTALGGSLLMPGMFVVTGWPRRREERTRGVGVGVSRGRCGEQTTWITGLKGRPDRVNLNNSEQKTASLLTSPLLHFHWQLSNKHTLSSKTFKRSFSLGFSTTLRGIFLFGSSQWKEQVD